MHHSHIDKFAQGDSPVHRLDARGKFLAVIGYSAVLISFGRYELAGLTPMAVLPLAMLWIGRVPLWFALRRVAILSPLILMLCLLSPVYDRTMQITMLGPMPGGWVTAGNIAAKFTLGVLALTALMSTTPFSLLLEGMRKLGLPQALTVQMGLLYRYIFVLIDQSMRIRRGRDFRGAALAPVSRRLSAAGGVIGALFILTLERSERVQTAMSARGWQGESHSLGQLKFTAVDAAFVAGACLYLVACRALYPMLING